MYFGEDYSLLAGIRTGPITHTSLHIPLCGIFLGSLLPQYMALCVSFVSFVCQKKFVCLLVGLYYGCVPPLVCVCSLWMRPPLYILWWKTTFGGRQPSVKDDRRWKTTFGGRRPSVEDNLYRKKTFNGRRPSVEDDLWWKKTFGGREPLVEDDLQWILACCLLHYAAFFFTHVTHTHT